MSGQGFAPARRAMPAALFVRADSVYRGLGLDCYDLARDALTFGRDRPAIAHPPCRSWSRLSHFAKPRAGEFELAPWAIETVRMCGGVVEHPYASRLWLHTGCNLTGRDRWGGLIVPVQQYCYGHRAWKWTRFYIVGGEFVPRIFCVVRPAETVPVERMCTSERERTPLALALDLAALVVAIAARRQQVAA